MINFDLGLYYSVEASKDGENWIKLPENTIDVLSPKGEPSLTGDTSFVALML